MSSQSMNAFINLPIKSLKPTVEFFTKLGFKFNPQFTSEDTTCMIISDAAYVMLLEEKRFAEFTKRKVSDASATEVITALSVNSKAEVDDMLKKALENGGKPCMPTQDMGFMYNCSFYDINDHHWEFFWMDPAAMQQQG